MGLVEEKRELLRNSRLFKDFSTEVIEAIIPNLMLCHFDADNLICMKGDNSDCLYVVHEGEVEVSVSSREGKMILLGVLEKGDVFGEVGLLDHGTRTANVSTKTDVSLYRLSSENFNNVVELFGVPEFRAMASYVCFLFRNVTNNLEETVFLDASIRIAKKVQNLYRQDQGSKDGNSFSVSISQESLGRMAGLSREAANKALCQLEARGLLEHKYKCVTIPDMEKFQRAIADF